MEKKLNLTAAKIADNKAALGGRLWTKFEQFAKERRPRETIWMKNLRQYLGKYDPDVANKIDPHKSKVYPRDTRARIRGFIAKMMEMMFPASDRNFDFVSSPIPTIDKETQDQIIEQLVNEHMLAFQQAVAAAEQQGGQPPTEPQPLSTEEIERRIKDFADERAERMGTLCEDQLSEIDYVQQAKKVLRSGALYGWGIMKGPEVRTQKARVWEWDDAQGSYIPKNKKVRRPVFFYKKIWDIYPDYSAPHWTKQEGIFERTLVNRHGLLKLSKRPDFLTSAIEDHLKLHPTGNYRQQPFESEMRAISTGGGEEDAAKQSRLYELIRYVGFLNGHELEEIGVSISEDKRASDVFVDVWMLDQKIIKADLAPFGEAPHELYHIFTYGEDEEAGFDGVGMPVDIRDTQLSIASVSRMLMDNAAAVAGPIFEVNEELLTRGKDVGPIHSFKTIYREGVGAEAAAQAVRQLSTDSHIAELLSVLQMLREQIDVETNLPSWMLGNAQPLGEAFRTSRNMSMMSSGANLIMKDIVRQFDDFTVSIMTSLYKFNMEFGPDDAKGDFNVIPKGVDSLVAKEVRGAALDQFLTTVTPEERAIMDIRKLLVDRMKARDLPLDRVYPEEQAQSILDGMRQAQSQASALEGALTQAQTAKTEAEAQQAAAKAQKIIGEMEASLAEIGSRVEQNLANAGSTVNRDQLEAIKVLVDGVIKQKSMTGEADGKGERRNAA